MQHEALPRPQCLESSYDVITHGDAIINRRSVDALHHSMPPVDRLRSGSRLFRMICRKHLYLEHLRKEWKESAKDAVWLEVVLD